MSVKVFAFFDARFQSTLNTSADDIWRSVLMPPLGQFQPPVGIPSTFGTYDLANVEQATTLIQAAKTAGLNGFVIDCRKSADGDYVTGGEVLAPLCGNTFELAFRWRNEPLTDADSQRADIEAVMRALRLVSPAPHDDRIILIVNAIRHVAEPAKFTAMVRAAAANAGLPGLYLIATCGIDRNGDLIRAGFDALIDPDPAEWHSIAPMSSPNGLDYLEVAAGLKDSSIIVDKCFSYKNFVNSRMSNRPLRGRVLPRVLAKFSDWPCYPFGGSTTLVDTTIQAYQAFLEKSIVWAAANFPQNDRVVFLDSWNDRTSGSEIEPSTQQGDALLSATRRGIERGRYVLQMAAVGNGGPTAIEAEDVAGLESLCRSIAERIRPSGPSQSSKESAVQSNHERGVVDLSTRPSS